MKELPDSPKPSKMPAEKSSIGALAAWAISARPAA